MTSLPMQRMTTVVMLIALGLYGCGGDEQIVTPPGPDADVYFTYPYDGQTNVSTESEMVVRTSSAVINETALNSGGVELQTKGGTGIDIDVELAPNTSGRSIIVQPNEPLATDTDYRLTVSGVETDDGSLNFPEEGIAFTTRPAEEGPRGKRSSAQQFELKRRIPDGDTFPIMDFSAFRFQFSQPVDEQSVDYGNTVTLETASGDSVDAVVVTRGRFVTVDPDDDLEAGREYRLAFTQGLESIYGEPLQGPFDGDFTRTFLPRESGPTEKMVLNAPAGGKQSPLTGDRVNMVPVQSTLIDTRSQQGGDLTAELAFVPNYPDVTPIRVPRGTTLTGDALDIKLGGAVDVGFDSGELGVDLVTDANGYLLPNPYSDQPDAPRMLRMFMDVGVRTGNKTAHAGFSQDVLHLEVVGKAIVEDGELVGDGITVVETDLLGVDRASGGLSFHMNAYRDQTTAPRPIADTEAPTVKSWMPGPDHVDKQRPGDPVILNFNEPLAADSVKDSISVLADGSPVDRLEVEQEGSIVVLRTDLEYGVTYDIQLEEGLTDLAGNALTPQTRSFTMPDPVEPAPGDQSSPFVYNTYPGYPCARTDQDLANGHTGRCVGGKSSDDRLPIPDMPANRAIRVHFSHPVNHDSFAGAGFRVAQIDSSGTVVDTVEGELDVRDQQVRFMPDEPWQTGKLYRYTLASNGDPQGSNCDVASMICGADGLPLKTQRLAQDPANAPATNGGGPDMENVFRGAEPVDSVFAHLDLRNTADLNANALRYKVDETNDEDEGNPIDNPDLLKNSIKSVVRDTDGDIDDASVGCEVGQDCPRRKFSYLNGGLDVEIEGHLTADEAKQRVADGELKGPLPQEVKDHGGVLFYAYPTMVQASNLIAYADTSVGNAEPANSGPMMMRVRYQCDARADATDPNPPNADSLAQCDPGQQGLVESWIVNVDGEDNPYIVSTLNTYLDAPELDPTVTVLGIPVGTDHNVRSNGLSAGLKGPIRFLDDGRMEIAGINQQDIVVPMELSAAGDFSGGTVYLEIPAQGIQLSFVSEAPRR